MVPMLSHLIFKPPLWFRCPAIPIAVLADGFRPYYIFIHMNLNEEIRRNRKLMGLPIQGLGEEKTIYNLDLIELGGYIDAWGQPTDGPVSDINFKPRENPMKFPASPHREGTVSDIRWKARQEYNNYQPETDIATDDPNTKKNEDFSDSVIKDVVWRAGEIHNDPRSGGLWFGESQEGVENFAWSVRKEKRQGNPYYINLRNPYVFKEGFWHGYVVAAENIDRIHGRLALMREFMSLGCDGIIIGDDTWNDSGDDRSVHGKQYVVFDKKNVKPA